MMRKALALLVLHAGQPSTASSVGSPSTGPALARSTFDADPEASAGLLSKATFAWLNPTLKLGSKQPLREHNLPPLRRSETASRVSDELELEIGKMHAVGCASQHHAVAFALWRCFGREFTMAGFVKLLSDACQLAIPLMLRHLISLIEAGASFAEGARITAALFAISCLQAFSLRHYFAQLFRTGSKVSAAVVGVSYRKLLRVSPTARLSSGEVTNLIGPDVSALHSLPCTRFLRISTLRVHRM